jgi:tRNA (guanine37-N1)-methyltransferase
MPFGGGPGMVMKPEPFFAAVDSIGRQRGTPDAIVLTSPDGERFAHRDAKRLSGLQHVVWLCGRYEGIDERVRMHLATETLSIGDYVLSGGELPALVMLDAVARLVPGVVGDEESVARDSFVGGLLDYPQYTRPAVFAGHEVPAVLLSGHHAAIARWRRQEALARTALQRPDLLEKATLDDDDRALLRGLEGAGAKPED